MPFRHTTTSIPHTIYSRPSLIKLISSPFYLEANPIVDTAKPASHISAESESQSRATRLTEASGNETVSLAKIPIYGAPSRHLMSKSKA